MNTNAAEPTLRRATVTVGGAEATVTLVNTRSEVDRASGSLMMFEIYCVQFTGRPEHTVEVEVGHCGTPYHERCDCRGFRYRRDCRHITALYESGLLVSDPEW